MPNKKNKKQSRKRGYFIVIDGGDGSGKATQAALLVDYLKSRKIKVKYFDFPQYDKFYGKIVGRFLAGEFGKLDDVSPYLASLPYALDRFSMKQEIEKWLNAGYWVLSNRFTSSNMAHQSAKINDLRKRNEYLAWITELEYVRLGTPKPNMVIYLKVPPKIASKLTNLKAQRTYIKTKKDIAEKDIKHQTSASEMYSRLARQHKEWLIIECVDKKGALLPIATVHKNIVQSICSKIPKLCHPKSKAL